MQGHKVTINKIDYYVPITWKDVTYKQAVAAIKYDGNREMQLCEMTGIPIDVLCKCDNKHVAVLFQLISFVDNMDVFDNDNVLPEYKDFDFGSIEYGEAEYCKKIMTEDSIGFEAVPKIIKRLVDFDINDKLFLEVIGTANFFLSRSISSIIVTPSLAQLSIVLNNSKLALPDCKSLEALERMLKSQEVAQ